MARFTKIARFATTNQRPLLQLGLLAIGLVALALAGSAPDCYPTGTTC